MGAGLSVDVGYGLVAVNIKCLSGDFARAMEILTELLRRPLFPPQNQVLVHLNRTSNVAYSPPVGLY